MTRAACPLKVISSEPEKAAPDPSRERLKHARILARKLARRDSLFDQLRQADAEVHEAFGPWAAGRSISLAEAREHLTSAGFLRQRKVWE